jgi:hypothetical protein
VRKCVKMSILLGTICPILAYGGKAKLYDLDSGKAVTLEFKNHFWTGKGSIKGTLADGTEVSGEFRTLAGGAEQHGSAVLTGHGTTLDCDYSVGSGNHGVGECRDNHGKRYKLIF